MFFWMLGQLCRDGTVRYPEHITEHIIKLEVPNREAVLSTVFLGGL